MANSLNKVQLIGNVTIDPEVKQTPAGQFVANFAMATNRTRKDASGTKQEQTEFTNIVIWGKLAEIVQSYVTKGKKIYIEGRLQTRSREDQEGTKRYKTEVIADQLILLGGAAKKSDDDFDEGFDEAPVKKKPKKSIPSPDQEINIEDIPF